MIDLCKKLSIPCMEKTLQRHDLYVADECFLTGTGAEVIAVTRIDGRPIGNAQPGPITRKLLEAFKKLTRG
jgi:branched-chain amino acid aminotransferase